MINPGQINLGVIRIEHLYSCPPTVDVLDIVYQTAASTVDTADCKGPTPKGPAVGVVRLKPTPTTCLVVQQGSVDGYPAATFIPRETLFMGEAGAPARAAVLPNDPGTIIQDIGYAKTDTELIVDLDRDWYTI